MTAYSRRLICILKLQSRSIILTVEGMDDPNVSHSKGLSCDLTSVDQPMGTLVLFRIQVGLHLLGHKLACYPQ